MPLPSPDFDLFLESFRGVFLATSGAGSLDLDALARLEGDERHQAETLLIERLLLEPDGRLPPALVVLRGDRCFDALRTSLQHCSGMTRLIVVRALQELGQGVSHVERALLDMLHKEPDAPVRVEVLRLLRGLHVASVEEAISGALDAAEPSVRLAACDALLERHELSRLAAVKQAPLAVLRGRLALHSEVVSSAAAVRLRGILSDLRLGRAPRQIGLMYEGDPDAEVLQQAERVLTSPARAGRERKSFPMPLLRDLDGFDRDWLALLLCQALQEGDLRAAPTMAALRDVRFLPLLREQSERPLGSAQLKAIQGALSELEILAPLR